MKQLTLTILFALGFATVFAQYPGNANDWIDYSAEYYKFKIEEKGIYRINKADLQAAGMSSADMIGEKFEMHHNGEVVPLYVSTKGQFGANDFIEFLGQPNDGHTDTALYEDPEWQPSAHKSLFEDAGSYFLTTTGNTSSISNAVNDLTNLPAKEEYFMHESKVEFDEYERGKSYVISSTVIHSSEFTEFEGYAKRGKGFGINQDVPVDEIYQDSSENVELEIVFAPYFYKPSFGTMLDYTVKIGSEKKSASVEKVLRKNIFKDEYSVNNLTEGTTEIQLRETFAGDFTYSKLSITYPRLFNFSAYDNFEFQLNTGSKYFELNQIPKVDNKVYVYDLSLSERFELPHNNKLKVKTSAGSGNKIFFDNEVSQIVGIEKITMPNLFESVDVLLIYPNAFDKPFNGENLVDKYVAHRRSAIGGAQTVLPVSIEDVYNQFSYGIEGHSASIKNYLLELKDLDLLPKTVLILGKGLEYNLDQENSLVPTYGRPGSDNLLASDFYTIYKMNTSIGRVSAYNLEELDNYIEKVIEYDLNMRDLSDVAQVKEKEWMKLGVHLGGGLDRIEKDTFKNYLSRYESIFESPNFGGEITSLYKQSNNPIETVESVLLDELISDGISLLTFFGHASPVATEFNIRAPEEYTNEGKYPLMINNGCFVGNIFGDGDSLSEDFIVAEKRGAIGFLGPSLYGIASGMNEFTRGFYNEMSKLNYGKTNIGQNIQTSLNNYKSNVPVAIITKQQMILNGDPSVVLNYTPKPDYLITEDDIKFEPDLITSETETFDVIVDLTNIGKAVNESMVVRLTRELPNGEVQVYEEEVSNLYFKQQIVFTLNTESSTSEGVNLFNVEIDPANSLDEVTRANNKLENPVQRQVTSSNVTPVVPYEFAITNDKDLTLFASTFTTEAVNRNFIMEIDTTEMFNSPLLKSTVVTSYGGTVSWKPEMNYQTEQEYYWRTKLDEDDAIWDTSSFIFLENYDEGWNQSSYYQYDSNQVEDLIIQQADDKFIEFGENVRNVNVRSGVWPITNNRNIGYAIDGYNTGVYRYDGSIGVVVFDAKSGVSWNNKVVEKISNFKYIGKYGSNIRDKRFTGRFFWYELEEEGQRESFMNLLNNEITGDEYVLVFSGTYLNAKKDNWEGDKAILGNTIYETLESKGAKMVKDIGDDTPYVFYYQNNNPSFEHTFEALGQDENSYIDQTLIMPARFGKGSMTSSLIGPAVSWDKFEWSWSHRYDNDPLGDIATYSIIGVKNNEEEDLLFANQTDSSVLLNSIDAQEYPYLKLVYYAQDAENQTPPQLDYWRVIYEKAGELAIDVNTTIEAFPLKLERGQDTVLKYSIDNIGGRDFNQVLVRYTFTDGKGNVKKVEKTYDAIQVGKSIDVEFDLEVEGFDNVGINSVLVDVNPDDDQLEQHHFNNIAYFNYEVSKDELNPYLDVTFDGIHIIDGDLVSDTPNVLISLTDENKYFALDNPDDFELVVTMPDGEEVVYTAESPEVTFYPGTEGNNVAKIEFGPTLKPGMHSLKVRAKDRSNNFAAENSYEVEFEVTDQDIITQVINYPNPFTTKTTFITNIIGDAPDQVLIQIFAPNGQMVQELQAMPDQITVSEGNNYYKLAEWDGNDQYGDPVGNGTYFYKVTMKRNGQTIEPKDDEAYRKYFHNGIGKLYILR